jgi:ribosomal-protein-alanine N-acetyltransferase
MREMQFKLEPMDENHARAIANWHYEGIYAFYDMEQDVKDLAELLTPRNWPDTYYAVVDEHDELVGFFCFEQEDETVAIGLGLRPDCTGKDLGQAFVEAGLEFAKEKFHPATFCLSVATFNDRAIKVYRRVGFKPDRVFVNETNGGQYEFLQMVKGA